MSTKLDDVRPAARAGRTLIPELVLAGCGRIHGMIRLQMITFLAQNEVASRYGQGRERYKFDSSRYVPYSDMLARDIGSDKSRIGVTRTVIKGLDAHRYYIKKAGLDELYGLALEPAAGKPAHTYAVYQVAAQHAGRLGTGDLLERTYSEFKPARGKIGAGQVRARLPSVEERLKGHGTYESTQVLAGMADIRDALDGMASVDAVTQRTILGASMAMVERSAMIPDEVTGVSRADRADPYALDPMLAEFCELDWLLVSYADAKKVMRNPHTIPLDEILTKEDKKRLSKSLYARIMEIS